MAKIKGRYVAQIEVNFEADEEDPDILPFDEIKRNTVEGLTPFLRRELGYCLASRNVIVTQLFADVWRCEDECID